MSTLPSLDVVIATHDRPEFLRTALSAVRAQAWPGTITTWVVFDQCPVDAGVASDDPHRPVRVLPNNRTPGLAGARNAGILAGTGEFVAFCDDDDVWLPDKVDRQVRRLLEGTEQTCVSGIVVEYADHSTTRIPSAADMELRNLVRNRVMEAHPSTVVVRRDALLGPIGLVDEQIPGSYGEDFDWIIRAAQAGPLAVVPEALVKVRWGSSLFSQRWRTIVEAIDYGLAKHRVFHEDPRALGRLYGRRAFALAALRDREALPAVGRTLKVAPTEKRAWLAAAVALRLVSAQRLMDLAHRGGHGI